MGLPQRKAVKRLVDKIPERDLSAARAYLEYLRDRGDPMLKALRKAPEDDEPPETDEAKAARGRADVRRGAVTSHAKLRKELGL